MTLRGIMLAAALLASMPTEAAACHRYSIWKNPWPQRCGVARQMVRPPERGHNPTKFREVLSPAQDEPNIALPGLARTDCVGGEADEPTRARLLLRAALENANAH
jgi:hypothetical protein